MSEKIKTQTGLIGFFDILGYQSLLENNEPEDIAEKVILFLNSVNNNLLNQFRGIEFLETLDRDANLKQIHEGILKTIKTLVFSDSILLTIPLSEEHSNLHRYYLWILFLSYCSRLATDMFYNGLPLRGAIAEGNYIIENNCFAGRAIIEAYKLSEQLNLSAFVFSDSAADLLNRLSNPNIPVFPEMTNFPFHKLFAIDYLVPMKLEEKRMSLLAFNPKPETDIRDEVYKSFWKHNKDIPTSAMTKLENTVKWHRYNLLQNDVLFERLYMNEKKASTIESESESRA